MGKAHFAVKCKSDRQYAWPWARQRGLKRISASQCRKDTSTAVQQSAVAGAHRKDTTKSSEACTLQQPQLNCKHHASMTRRGRATCICSSACSYPDCTLLRANEQTRCHAHRPTSAYPAYLLRASHTKHLTRTSPELTENQTTVLCFPARPSATSPVGRSSLTPPVGRSSHTLSCHLRNNRPRPGHNPAHHHFPQSSS